MAGYYARRCPEEADDLLQEAWLGVLEALPTLDRQIGEPEQYLLRYARWRLLDAVRRAYQRHDPLSLDDDLTGAGTDSALETLALHGFLDQLTPIQRAIVGCLLAGCTWREAGKVLDCSSANIAYHVRRIGEQYRRWRVL